MKCKLSVVLLLTVVAFISGCVGNTDATSVIKNLPEVQKFLSEHPNAEIKASLWSASAVNDSIGEIRQECDSQIDVQPLWKVSVTENNVKLKLWLNSNQQPLCVLKEGVNNSELTQPANAGISSIAVDSAWDNSGVISMTVRNTGTMEFSDIGKFSIYADGIKQDASSYAGMNGKFSAGSTKTIATNIPYPLAGVQKTIRVVSDNGAEASYNLIGNATEPHVS